MRRFSAALLMLVCWCALSVTVGGCSTPAPRTLTFESDSRTVDGLRLLSSREGHYVYLRPGVDMKDYSSILVDPFMVSYANPRDAPGGPVRTVDEETERRVTNLMREMFIQNMDRTRSFDVVEEPGPAVLRVQGWLYDVVVEEPPREDPRNFPLCFAEASVILTVRHSETALPLARVVDKVKLSCAVETHARFHSATWADVKAVLRPWAAFLPDWLEELRTLPDAS